MIKFLGSLFKNDSDEPPPETQQTTVPQVPRKIYGDNPTPDSEVILKIVLIGGVSTGKTSIVRRYLQGCFTHQYIPTIGIDMSTAKLQSRSNPEAEYRIQLWDVAHAEVRGKHHANIFKGAAGIVMVFDCCNVQSVAAVDEWRMAYEDSLKNTPRVPMVLLANKSDTGQPVIKAADLDTYCERGGYAVWRLTSSRSGNTVLEAMDKMLEIAIEFRDLQIASRRRKKPDKLITSKSQLLSPPQPTVASIKNPAGNSLGTSMVTATNFTHNSLGTSSSSTGSSVNDNTPVTSYSSYASFPRTATRPMSNSAASSQRIPHRPPPLALDTSNSVSTSPSLSLSGESVPKATAANIGINSTTTTATTATTTTTTTTTNSANAPDPVDSRAVSSSTITAPTVNSETPVNNFSESSSDETEIKKKSNNKIPADNTDSLSLEASDSISDVDSSSTSATNSASASAHNSTHSSSRNIGAAMRSSESMDFSYLNGERPSIFAITNALAVEDIKLGELVGIAEDFYSKLKADLDQLFMNVKPARKSDLQILEFQRFDEYVKLMEALQSHKSPHIDRGDDLNGDGSVKKLAPEGLQILLSENMKKWNQLIMNLHTEVSLYKSGVHDDSRSTNKLSSLKTSASDTMLYRYDNPNIMSPGASSKSTTGNSPTKSKDSSALATPPLTNDQGESLVKRQQPANTRRMGFGFRNVGKNSSAILQLVNPNQTSFSLDSDNISSPPSPYNSVHSPIPSSPSTSPASSPPMYRSRASSNGETQSHSASSSGNTPSAQDFRAHMESNGSKQSKSHNSRPHSHHTRSVSLTSNLSSLLPPDTTDSNPHSPHAVARKLSMHENEVAGVEVAVSSLDVADSQESHDTKESIDSTDIER